MVIDGSNTHFLYSNPLAPRFLCRLESICYHYLYHPVGQRLSDFPALKSLQFAHGYCEINPVKLTTSLAELQSLRTLALYNIVFGPHSTTPLMAEPDNCALVSARSPMHPSGWRACNADHRVLGLSGTYEKHPDVGP
ncbi:unnamed protein product [Somion occarium]|uniref:Uncharacterized protein n=1 Tax=Somion occarium TaxID=3059160 RepID=A0ABP1EC57_9APHY